MPLVVELLVQEAPHLAFGKRRALNLHPLSVRRSGSLVRVATPVSTNRQTRPYGSWRSPITADAIVAGVIGLGQIQLDGDDIYWIEQRPAEAGRNVVVRRRANGVIEDITPPGYNARTRVWRWRLSRAPGNRLVCKLQGSTALSAGSRPAAGGDHAGEGYPPCRPGARRTPEPTDRRS